MNLIFSHNVGTFCILHLTFNVKTPKTSAKFSEKSRNKRGSDCFFYGVLCEVCNYTNYYWVFLLVFNMNLVPGELYLGQ